MQCDGCSLNGKGDNPLNAYTLNNYLNKIKAAFAFVEETKKILHSLLG